MKTDIDLKWTVTGILSFTETIRIIKLIVSKIRLRTVVKYFSLFDSWPFKGRIYTEITYFENSISRIYSSTVSYGWSDVALQFLKFLAFVAPVSYRPVSYKKTQRVQDNMRHHKTMVNLTFSRDINLC